MSPTRAQTGGYAQRASLRAGRIARACRGTERAQEMLLRPRPVAAQLEGTAPPDFHFQHHCSERVRDCLRVCECEFTCWWELASGGARVDGQRPALAAHAQPVQTRSSPQLQRPLLRLESKTSRRESPCVRSPMLPRAGMQAPHKEPHHSEGSVCRVAQVGADNERCLGHVVRTCGSQGRISNTRVASARGFGRIECPNTRLPTSGSQRQTRASLSRKYDSARDGAGCALP